MQELRLTKALLGLQGYPEVSFFTTSWKERGNEEVLRGFDEQIWQLSPSLLQLSHMAAPIRSGGWEVRSSCVSLGHKALVISCLVFAVALTLVSLPSFSYHPIHTPQCCQS